MMSRRAQAAMEFLMTYGWAILVVLVIIGALAFFGVLSPDSLMPEKCSLPLQLACKDFSVTDGPTGDTFIISFVNNAGRAMVIRDFNVTSGEAIIGAAGCFSDAATTVNITAGLPTTTSIANGETKTLYLNRQRQNSIAAADGSPDPVQNNFNCMLTNTGRPKDKFKFSIIYSWQDSQSIKHYLEGELLAKVQR